MPSRLRVFSSVCLFAVLFSMQLLAQSSSTSFAQHRARALKRSAEFSGGLQTPALSFASAVQYLSGGNGPNAVAVADVNRDGIPDLVVANWCTDSTCVASSVGVLLGNGDGTFKPAVAYGSGGLYADSVAVADVNGDGKPDIVVGTCGFPKIINCVASGGKAGVLLGNGDGTFQPAVSYSLGGFGATSVAVADVNGDGKLDLLVATGSAVGVLLGNGDGTFQTVTTYSSGGFTALSVAVEDVNGDAKPDLVVANWCTDSSCTASSVGVLLGNGDGTFQTVVAYNSGGLLANSVVIGDVNGDGKLDLVVVNGSTTGTDAGNVGVLLGKGDGTFQTAVPYNRGGFGAGSVALADVNGDGKPDVVVSNCSTSSIACAHSDGDVAVLLGKGDGTFPTAVSFGSGGTTPFGVAVGDVNGDGRPDIVAANCSSANCGQGTGYAGVLINQTSPWLVYASLAEQVDYFGEGTADFAVWRPSNATWYIIDTSGSNFLSLDWGLSTDTPVIGDYDGDGKTDIAVFRPSNGNWYIIPSSTQQVVRCAVWNTGRRARAGRLRRRWQNGRRGMATFERNLVHPSKHHRQVVWSAVWNTG